jgi:hypothetical protein
MSAKVTGLSVTPATGSDVRLTTDTTIRARAIYLTTKDGETAVCLVKDGNGGTAIGQAAPGGGSFTIGLSVFSAQEGEWLKPSDYWIRMTTGSTLYCSYEAVSTP